MHRRGSSDGEMTSRRSSRVINVPFSWEKQPGMSKVAPAHVHRLLSDHLDMEYLILKLTPPPRLLSQNTSSSSTSRSGSARFVLVDRQTCLPLCSVQFQQPNSFTNSFRMLGGVQKNQADPFLAAFIKCTTTAIDPPGFTNGNKKYAERKKKTMFTLSCKSSCAVREDSIVKMPQPPKYK